MPAVTPSLRGAAALAPLASRYVTVDSLPWLATRFPGVDFKILIEDPATGGSTQLVRFAPGASLPLHEHVEVEQSYILSGSLVDNEGEATVGNFVWRPAGSRHVATAPNGCLLLAIFQRPNRFFDGQD
jgi:anti-sigma factor ChrR (cupin superfamily)